MNSTAAFTRANRLCSQVVRIKPAAPATASAAPATAAADSSEPNCR
jgi:hypothetical protein